jgi:hypothetical protein
MEHIWKFELHPDDNHKSRYYSKKTRTPYKCVCVCTHLRGKESRRNLDGSDISILYIILYMHFTIKPQMHLQTLDNNLQLHSQKRRDISKQH